MSANPHSTVMTLHADFAAGRLTPTELHEALLADIAERNPTLNAYVRIDEARGRAAARASTDRYKRGAPIGSLDGIPVGIKDNIAVAGLARPGAIAAYQDYVAPADAPVVDKLRKAGAVVVGMLNMDEGAFGSTTESPHYGRCYNPLRPHHTPGGSSGGSAAAVTSGLCTVALGTDTLGSVRIPASYCGIVGFKPSHGAIDTDGVLELSPTLDHVGVLARTVADAALAFQAIADRPLGWKSVAEPRTDFGNSLTLGILDPGDAAAPEVTRGFKTIVALLEKSNIELVTIGGSGFDPGRARRDGLLITEAEAALVHEAALKESPEGFSPLFRDAMAYAQRQPALRIAKAYKAMEDARRWLAKQFARCHAILSPTTPHKAIPFNSHGAPNAARFTSFANLAGVPALALPIADGDALPMSVQLVAPFGKDDGLLALGERIAGCCPPPRWSTSDGKFLVA
jgi:aspartyl-tRNA(Asn)/glutamyl-tRNA(Gln) amidotransferase subunit A